MSQIIDTLLAALAIALLAVTFTYLIRTYTNQSRP